MQQACDVWTNAYIHEHGDVADLWTALIRPQAGSLVSGYAYAIATTGTVAP